MHIRNSLIELFDSVVSLTLNTDSVICASFAIEHAMTGLVCSNYCIFCRID
jgi:hypothetical protein